MTRPPERVPADLVAHLRAAGCVFAEEEAAELLRAAEDDTHLATMVGRRTAGVPLEHVVGSVLFGGLRLVVDDGVFVPRRRTELLVELAVEHLRGTGTPDRVPDQAPCLVELCCGCAPVATAVATRLPGTTVHAADLDPRAVRCARRNLAPVDGRAYVGDLDAPLPAGLAGRVDVLAANAPYVPSDALHLMPVDAREHEPRVALDGGPDGLTTARRVVTAAGRWLRPGGLVLVETGRDQAAALVEHARAQGLRGRVVRSEEHDATAVAAERPGPERH